MTFKEFHILNENKIEDFINSVNNTDLKKELKEALKSSIIAMQGDKFKININNADLKKFVNDNKKELGLELDSLKKSSISRDKLIQIVFDGNEKEFNDTIVSTDDSKSGEHKSELNSENSNGGSPVEGSIEKDSSKQKTEFGDEKIVDNFFANKDFTPIALDYSDKTIEKNFLNSTKSEDDLSDFGILYTAIEKFKIEPEQIDQIKEIAYVLKRHANKDGNDELSLEEYTNAMISISNTSYTIAKEPNIIKFILFLLKIKTKGIDDNVKLNSNTFMTKPKVRANLLSDVNQDKRKSLLYTFFTMKDTSIVPNKENKFGQILSNFKSLIESVNLKLDSVLDSKMTNLKQIDDFVKNPPEAKSEEKKPEKEGLASRVRGQYLSKRITDNKRNLDRYDRETEKLKDDDSYSKLSDYNQAGKVADKETYGFNIDKPTADEDSINNFEERITHLFQKDLLDITGALRIKGIAGERSEANRKNNVISRTWEEAIMRSNNKILIEGFFDNRLKDTKYALRDIKNKALKNFTDDNKAEDTPDSNGEYTSNAENRANDIFKDYMQRGKDIIGRYVKKMHDASRKVEAGKTYAQRVNKEWSITKAYYDLLRKLFDLKLACRDACEEGGLTKIKNKIGKFTERFTGDKEYREKNAISNADAVKKMLEKQIINVKGPNDLQVIAKLSLFDILFNSKSAEEAINKINNGDFEGIGLNNVKDFSGQAKRGSPLNLSNPSAVYNKPAQLFKVIGVNAAEITEDGLTQLQKSLDKEDCLAQVNKFKNIVEKVMEKITPKTSISLENLFLKNGFVLKEDAQSLAAAKDNAEKIFAQGIDLTDIVSMLDDSSWIPFRQAIGGNVLVTGKKAGKEISLLFTKNGFKAAQNAQEKLGEEEVKNKQQQQQQQANALNNNNVADTLADNKPNATYWNSDASVVTTNAVDSTYGNGYQKQTPQSRMKEIIYKKGNYTVKTRQMI